MPGPEITRKVVIEDGILDPFIKDLEKAISLSKQLGGNALKSTSLPAVKKDTEELTAAQIQLEKINKQIITEQAKLNDEYIAAQKVLKDVKDQVKAKTAEDIKNTQAVNAQNSSLVKLDAALKKNRADYAALTNEQERNSVSGKKLLATIQSQDKASKELSATLGQAQKNVGNYGESFKTLAPGLSSAAESAQGFGRALLALAANPVVLILAAIVATIAVLGKAVNVFFDDTLEGQEKLNELSSSYKATVSVITDKFKDLGRDIVKSFDSPKQAVKDFGNFILTTLTNSAKGFVEVFVESGNVIKAVFGSGNLTQSLLDLSDAFIQIGTGVTDATGKINGLGAEINKRAEIALALAKLENDLVKEHIKDVVDDANTELQVNELLEKSKNKLLYTDRQRLEYLDQAIALLKEQVKGDIELAQADLKAGQERIRLNGGVIQQNKLISEYTDAQLKALNVNADGVKELANLEAALLKVQSDASAKQKGFTKLRTAAVLEIEKAERDRIERAITAENNYQKAVLNAVIAANDEILKDENSSLADREEALGQNIQNKADLYKIDQDNALRALKNGIRDRLIAEGGSGVSDSRIEADKTYQKEKLAIEQSFADKDRQLTFELINGIKGIYAKGYADINADVKKYTDDQLKIINEQYTAAGSTLGFEEYQDRIKEVQQKGQTFLIESQIQYLKESIDHLGENTKEAIILKQKLHDAEVALAQDSANKQLEIDKEVAANREKVNQALLNLQNATFAAAQQINDNIAQKQTDRLDKELNDFKDSQDRKLDVVKRNEEQQLALAGDNADKRAEIQKQSKAAEDKINEQSAKKEKQIQAEKNRIQQRQARYDKAIALTQAIVNTAEGVTSALKVAPPYGFILAALVGAAGALQVASIASKPIPQFFKGTDNAPGGLAMVGEMGTELVVNPQGRMQLTPSSASLMNLEKGSKVFTHEETVKMLGMSTLAKVNSAGQQVDNSKELLNKIGELVNVSRENRPVNMDIVRIGNDIYEVKKSKDQSSVRMKQRRLNTK
jgi:hypothetical protein